MVQVIHHCIQVHLKDGLMHFLLQLLRDEIEAERTGTLQQDQFVVETSKGITRQEMGHAGKELLIGNLNLISLRHQLWSDTDELLNATLHSQVAHLGIERFRRSTCLEHIREDQGLLQHPFRLTTVHEVEGDIKRVDITVIGVVDQQTSTLTFLHLQAHGHRFELRHTVSQLPRGQSEAQSHHCTGNGVLDRSLIDEWNRIGILLLLPDICNTGSLSLIFNILHKEGSLLIALRPSNLLTLVLHTTDTTAHDIIVRAIHHRLRVVHQFEFLQALLLHRTEVLLMGGT